MNIVQAYLLYNNKFIMLVSGISGCGKTNLAKNFAKNLNFTLLEQQNYYKEGWDKTEVLGDGSQVINYHSDDAIDWDKLNKAVEDASSKGVILTGSALPEDKLTFTPDIHMHVNISKQGCLEKRKQFLEKHKEEYKDDYEAIGTPKEKLKMNKLIFPYYLEVTKRSKINKFFNLNKNSSEEVWNEAWDYVINHINSFIERFHKTEYKEWVKENPQKLEEEVAETMEEPEPLPKQEVTISDSSEDKEETSEPDKEESESDIEIEYESPTSSDDIKDGPIEFPEVDPENNYFNLPSQKIPGMII